MASGNEVRCIGPIPAQAGEPFTDEEIAARPVRAELNTPAPASEPALIRERAGDGPDAPVVVRSADPEPGFAIPAPAIRTPRSAQTSVRAHMEGGDLVAARAAIDSALRSREFAAAFQAGDVRGWPVGVMPDIPDDALARVPRALRTALAPRLVVDGVVPGKLRSLHAEVTIEQYRMLQLALDRGELLVRARRGRDRYPSLIAHTPRPGGWWRHAVRIEHDRERLTLATVFGQRDSVRDDLLAADYVTVVRGWDRRRWEEGE